ncbi:MAG: sigma-70 family RNA polymerase sigma factor, partial [Aquificaceae bacterium]
IIAFVCEFVIFRRLVAKTLDYREKLVLQLLYYEELPLKEVAGLLGVSMARVSQIKANAIEKLKRFLASVE